MLPPEDRDERVSRGRHRYHRLTRNSRSKPAQECDFGPAARLLFTVLRVPLEGNIGCGWHEFHLGSAADTATVATEGDGLSLLNDVLKVGLRPPEVHALQGKKKGAVETGSEPIQVWSSDCDAELGGRAARLTLMA